MVAITSQELLQAQLEQANTRRQAKGVELSRSTGVSFNALLQKMVREIRKDVDRTILPLLRELEPQFQADAMPTMDQYGPQLLAALRALVERWSSPAMRQIAEQTSTEFVRNANRVNRERFERDLGTFGIDVFSDSPDLQDYIQVSIADNTRLIMSIPDQYLTNVESIVLTNVRAGGRPAAVATQLREQFGVTRRRAQLIARDQTAKVNGDLAARRQQSSGLEYFEWIDSDDERVRRRHGDIADKVTAYGEGIYRWDNPPLSNTGVPIIPGSDFQCRCIARPVLSSEVERNQAAGNVRPGVRR